MAESNFTKYQHRKWVPKIQVYIVGTVPNMLSTNLQVDLQAHFVGWELRRSTHYSIRHYNTVGFKLVEPWLLKWLDARPADASLTISLGSSPPTMGPTIFAKLPWTWRLWSKGAVCVCRWSSCSPYCSCDTYNILQPPPHFSFLHI